MALHRHAIGDQCHAWPAAGTDRSYLPLLGNLLAGIEKYWKAPGYESYVVHGGGGQRYYDDNAWLGIEFVDAYRLLGEEQRLLFAHRAGV